MKILEQFQNFWRNRFFRSRPLTEEERMLCERLSAIEVNRDGGSSIKDLKRYFRNDPTLKEDVEGLKAISMGVALNDDGRPVKKSGGN